MRTEWETPPRQAVAVGLGLAIGCTPVFGAHLPLCLLCGWLFGLNKLKLYIAANISNPLILPFVLFAEVQLGSWFRRGSFYPFAIDSFRTLDPWMFARDLGLGTLIVGTLLGVVGGWLTYIIIARRLDLDAAVGGLIERASARFLTSGLLAWEVCKWEAASRSDLPPDHPIGPLAAERTVARSGMRTRPAARVRSDSPEPIHGRRLARRLASSAR